MGLFDRLTCIGPEFRCSEGHDLADEEFQTKDLGCTMGYGTIDGGRLTFEDGGWGDPLASPISATIDVYCSCAKCPAFVQAGTGNLVAHWVAFDVAIVDDVVASVTRTSPSCPEWLASEPALEYMAEGPMGHAEAERLHVHYREMRPAEHAKWLADRSPAVRRADPEKAKGPAT